MNLALSFDTNDLVVVDGAVQRVDEGRRAVQTVRNKLMTSLEGWVLDHSVGWLGANDLEKGYDLFDLELRARNIILGTDGVDRIVTMKLYVTNRKLMLEFEAVTQYGVIDLSIPFSSGDAL